MRAKVRGVHAGVRGVREADRERRDGRGALHGARDDDGGVEASGGGAARDGRDAGDARDGRGRRATDDG